MKNRHPRYYLFISHNKRNDEWYYSLSDYNTNVYIVETVIKDEIKIYLDLLNLHLYDKSVRYSDFSKESQFTEAMIAYYER